MRSSKWWLLVMACAACDATSLSQSSSGTLQAQALSFEASGPSAPSLPSAWDQVRPQVVWDGTQFVSAWPDRRSGVGATVFGARIQAGVLREPADLQLSPFLDGTSVSYVGSVALPSFSSVGLASDGAKTLVVWMRGEDSNLASASAVLGSATLSATGAVTQTTPAVPIESGLTQPVDVRVASSGAGFMAVWTDQFQRVFAMLYDVNGVPTTTTPLTLMTVSYPSDAVVAWNGSAYLVAWSGRVTSTSAQGTWVRRYDASGVAIDSASTRVSGNNRTQHLALVPTTGTSVMIAWSDDVGSQGSEWDVKGVVVTGVTPGPVFTIDNAAGWQRRPALAFDGTRVLAVWQTGNFPDIHGVLLSPVGAHLTTAVPLLAEGTNLQAPSVAAGGGEFFVTAERFVLNSGRDIVGARVDANGALISPAAIEVSSARPTQVEPSVAWASQLGLVVWSEWNGHDWDIRGLRLDSTGTPLDSVPLTISGAIDNQTSPAVASDGTNFFVVWVDDRNDSTGFYTDIFGVAVQAAGGPIAPDAGVLVATDTIDISGTRGGPKIAFDGQRYLATWHERASTVGTPIMATSITPAGVISAPVKLGDVDGDSNTPGLGCAQSRSQCVVAFPVVNGNQRPLGLVRVGAGLQVLDAVPRRVANTGSGSLPAVAFDGQQFLVAWVERGAGDRQDLHGRRLALDGGFVDPGSLAFLDGGVGAVALDFDGTRFQLVVQARAASDWNIVGREVSPASLAIGPAVTLAGGIDDERAPVVAARQGLVAFAWSEWRAGADNRYVVAGVVTGSIDGGTAGGGTAGGGVAGGAAGGGAAGGGTAGGGTAGGGTAGGGTAGGGTAGGGTAGGGTAGGAAGGGSAGGGTAGGGTAGGGTAGGGTAGGGMAGGGMAGGGMAGGGMAGGGTAGAGAAGGTAGGGSPPAGCGCTGGAGSGGVTVAWLAIHWLRRRRRRARPEGCHDPLLHRARRD